MPNRDERASRLRQHLEQSGAKRARLFADSERQKHMTFHDLRATGITWMAVRGDDPLRIEQRAGHKGFATTEMCIREAENLAAGFGDRSHRSLRSSSVASRPPSQSRRNRVLRSKLPE